MKHIGMDVHKRETQLCIIDSATGQVTEQRIRTERQRFKEVLGQKEKVKVLLEASTESEWVAECVEELGHEVVVADPNFSPMYGTRTRRVKTDKRDAKALADACVSGTYREAHRPSAGRRQLKAQLAVRDALVRERAKHIGLMGALVRQQGLRVATGLAEHFITRLREVELPSHLKTTLEPLVEVVEVLNKKLKEIDESLEDLATTDAEMKRLCTVPSVGPVTAAAFVATVDTAERFKGAHQVQAYLGLVPSEMSSGEKQRRGHITKTGNSRMRALLVQVAIGMVRIKKMDTKHLWEWASGIETRRGKKVAAVALARKMAGILWAMMRDKSEFRSWQAKEAAASLAA